MKHPRQFVALKVIKVMKLCHNNDLKLSESNLRFSTRGDSDFDFSVYIRKTFTFICVYFRTEVCGIVRYDHFASTKNPVKCSNVFALQTC